MYKQSILFQRQCPLKTRRRGKNSASKKSYDKAPYAKCHVRSCSSRFHKKTIFKQCLASATDNLYMGNPYPPSQHRTLPQFSSSFYFFCRLFFFFFFLISPETQFHSFKVNLDSVDNQRPMTVDSIQHATNQQPSTAGSLSSVT